ncbi:unnamed protein product [Calicophoron daubneyi]|uniref:Uncharacterized protein n=1 Tax=Calicophoron daubneyi TaxID=300641 RepID=A0AAV2TJ10_CALDB
MTTLNSKMDTLRTPRVVKAKVSDQADPVLRPELARFICGGIAGTVSRTMTAPIDRVKVMRQTGAPEMMGKNFIQSWRLMFAEGGFLSLWRGNAVNVLKNGPESAIRFGLHGWLKSLLFPESKGQLRPEQRMLVASLSGAVSLTCTYPAEIMKTRMALRRSTDSSSIVRCIQQIYREGGLRGLYRGYKISMLSYVPYSGMELFIYEMLKRRYMAYRQSKGRPATHLMPPYMTIAMVMTSCCIPILIVYPANLLRTRFQASSLPKAAPVIKSLVEIFRKDGFFGLYQGMGASLSKTLPSVCITYFVFEITSELLRVPGLGSR